MPSDVSTLYDPLIERDVEAIPVAVRAFAGAHDIEELWNAVARFALLAYSPSEHGKHAVLACVAARELLGMAGERAVDLLTECAIYAASSRQPWSEPPISDPPALAPDQRRDLTEIRAAIEAGDRLRGERWLAARLDDQHLSSDFFTVASDTFRDLGHGTMMAVATWKLASIFDPRGRFATLRVAVWEWTAARGPRSRLSQKSVDAATLATALVERFVRERGSLISGHALLLFDAALEAASLAGDVAIETRACDFLNAELRADEGESAAQPRGDGLEADSRGPSQLERSTASRTVPVYRLARDYGECVQMHALAGRLIKRFPSLPVEDLLTAARQNLETAPSFEEWSFA